MSGGKAQNWSISRQYNPDEHGVGIVHIGPGAFHRAHQADYTDAALEKSGGDWRICAVSMNSRHTVDQLRDQNGRYTLVVRSDKDTEYHVIGALSSGLAFSDEGPDKIEQLLANPDVKIVSLTVTEKAYILPEKLDLEDNNIFCLMAQALRIRRDSGQKAFTVLSCDNLPNNGSVVREAVLTYANEIGEDLKQWVLDNAAFPSTMVDRITPASTNELIEEVERATGFRDPLAIETEAFSQWVVEDNFCNGRPQWDQVGVLMVPDVTPYEHMKLRMLNGAHSMLAYAGYLSGHKYVRDVMQDDVLAQLVARHMNAAAATLAPLQEIDFSEYAASLLDRFKNPNIAHETYQIAMDGSKKLPQRIFEPALDAMEKGADMQPFALATSVWVRYLFGHHDDGTEYELRDPLSDLLSKLISQNAADIPALVTALFELPNFVPQTLAEHQSYKDEVVSNLIKMEQVGVRQMLQDMVHEDGK